MQEGHKGTEDIGNIRRDYTNLQIVYIAKLFLFIIIAVAAVVQTRDSFHSLAVNACTYSIGIVFDFIVVILTNNGPRTKNIDRVKIAFLIPVVTLGLGLIILFGSYDPDSGLVEDILSWSIRLLMISESFLGPYTELSLNRPNDD